METLLYVLGFVIGALGTWFLLYFLKTRKTLRQQHEIIMEFPLVLHALTKKIVELQTGKDKESAEQKDKHTPCESEMPGRCVEGEPDTCEKKAKKK